MFKKHPVLYSIGIAALVAFVIHMFLGIAVVSGNSMSPSLEDGDYVLFNKHTNPEKNQIVVAYLGDKYIVKRIVAVEGDVITIYDGILLINGEEQGFAEYGETGQNEVITLAEDEFFLLGDNREYSKDSRVYGIIYRYEIIGVVERKL